MKDDVLIKNMKTKNMFFCFGEHEKTWKPFLVWGVLLTFVFDIVSLKAVVKTIGKSSRPSKKSSNSSRKAIKIINKSLKVVRKIALI